VHDDFWLGPAADARLRAAAAEQSRACLEFTYAAPGLSLTRFFGCFFCVLRWLTLNLLNCVHTEKTRRFSPWKH
jgi:hypothetical protein